MLASKLLSHLSELSPQARYALMKLWLENRHSLPLQISVHDCARQLAIPRARAGKVINELIDKGHLEPDYRLGQRGRPKRFIDISVATAERLRNLTPKQPGDTLHLDSIQRLLAHRTSDTDTPLLSPANIIFLIALLSCANECGAVYGLGTAKLTSYTGMTAQRIKLQIRKMRELKIMLFSVPGMTGARILGRTTAVYWLDLNHPLLKPVSHPTIIEKSLVSIQASDTANALFDIAHQVRALKLEDRGKSGKILSEQEALDQAVTKLNAQQVKLIPGFKISLMDGFFRDVDAELRLAFQLVVDRVAHATAIARIIDSLHENQISPTWRMLRMLYQELLPVRFRSNYSDRFPTKESRRMLVVTVLSIANTMATEIIAELPGKGATLSSAASFELVPIFKTSTDRLLLTKVSPLNNQNKVNDKPPANED